MRANTRQKKKKPGEAEVCTGKKWNSSQYKKNRIHICK